VLSRITIDREQDTKDEVTIYIKTNGVHTDIVVPVKTDLADWSQEVKYSCTSLQDTCYPFLAVGWGDKGFYLETPEWKDLKFSVAFNAAFGRSTSAIHATFYKQLRENGSCRKISISREQYARLVGFITASFQKDEDGHFMHIKTNANYGISDAFYEARGSYSLFHTCNSWANSALKACGQKSCLWTIFDTGIFLKYAGPR
jgi:uncharacterized protein (TIGR02117 family)